MVRLAQLCSELNILQTFEASSGVSSSLVQGDGPARYTLPSLLQGHPPSQSSGTLMSLQEGIAEPCMHKPAGRRPEPNLHSGRAVCGTSPEYSFPASAHTLPKPSARGSFHTVHPHPLLHLPGEGERIVGERPVCSVATSGCPKRSEDGFPAGARNIPPRPVQPKRHPKLLAQPPHPT